MSIVKKLSRILALSILLGASANSLSATSTGQVTTLWYWPGSSLMVSIVGDLGCVTSVTATGHVVSQLLTAKAHGRNVTITCDDSMSINNLTY